MLNNKLKFGSASDNVISEGALLSECIVKLNLLAKNGKPRLLVVVKTSTNEVIGTLTDGDLRRMVGESISLSAPIEELIRRDVCFVTVEQLEQVREGDLEALGDAIERFHAVDHIIVKGKSNELIGLLEKAEFTNFFSRDIAVWGMGFVGLTLAVVLAQKKFNVVGLDRNEKIVAALSEGKPHFFENGLHSALNEVIASRRLSFSVPRIHSQPVLHHIITVGTPLQPDGSLDLSQLRSATRAVGEILSRGALVSFRSTVPVGSIRSICVPILEESSNLVAGEDFSVSFAPERTVEGDALRELVKLPQVIGGLTQNCVLITEKIYRELTTTVVHMESLEAAELVKLINNGYRNLIFNFSNQIAITCSKFDISANDLIDSANAGYPRNPIPKPSPGVGGPCLTKDPSLLAYPLTEASYSPNLSEYSRMVETEMISYLAGLAELVREANSPKVLILGIAFKGDPPTSDVRGSSSLGLAEQLLQRGFDVWLFDFEVSSLELNSLFGSKYTYPTEVEMGFSGASICYFLNNHSKNTVLSIKSLVSLMVDKPAIFDGWRQLDKYMIESTGARYLELGSKGLHS